MAARIPLGKFTLAAGQSTGLDASVSATVHGWALELLSLSSAMVSHLAQNNQIVNVTQAFRKPYEVRGQQSRLATRHVLSTVEAIANGLQNPPQCAKMICGSPLTPPALPLSQCKSETKKTNDTTRLFTVGLCMQHHNFFPIHSVI